MGNMHLTQWRRKETESGGPPVAYLESAKGGGRGPGDGSPPEAEALLLMND